MSNINITRKTTGNRVFIVKAEVLPNGERRGKEAEREQKQWVHRLCRGAETRPNLYKPHTHRLMKECNTEKKWNFPLSGEKSLGRWLMPNVFPVLDTRFWQVPVHKWSTDLCSCSKGEDLYSTGTESSMALIIWMNTSHFWWWKACKGLHKWSFDQRENTRGTDSVQDWKETECWPKAEKF